jgi:hypothetical protein
MTREIRSVFKRAIELPLDSKADLVELLLDSIRQEDSAKLRQIDKAWAKEAQDRFEAFLRGEIPASPMRAVMNTLKKRHAR